MAKDPDRVGDIFQHPDTGKWVVVDRKSHSNVGQSFDTASEASNWCTQNGFARTTLPQSHFYPGRFL